MESALKPTVEELQNQITSLEQQLNRKDDELIILKLALKGLIGEQYNLLSLIPNERKMIELERKAYKDKLMPSKNKFFDYMNKNLLNNVLSYLDFKDILHCRRTNKNFYNLSQVILIERTKKKLECKPQAFDYRTLEPIFDNISNQLQSLNVADIEEMNCFRTPPIALKVILDLLALILINKRCWTELRRNNPRGVLNMLLSYDKEQVLIDKYNISKMLADTNVTYEQVSMTSRAGAGFFRWIQGIGQYQSALRNAHKEEKHFENLEKFLKELQQ